MTPTSIETMTGRFVDLVTPDPATIDIRDIAWATSRVPRYVGHTISAVPYTIAQHSIFVVDLALALLKGDEPDLRRSFYTYLDDQHRTNPNLREACHLLLDSPPSNILLLELLLHDASEAYLVDVPTPLKEADGFRQVYRALEDRMMLAIRQALGMHPDPDAAHEVVVKWADRAALTIEAHHLIRSRGANWGRLLDLGMTSMRLFKEPKEPIKVYEDFLRWVDELTNLP